jgi:hypothetical protein
MSASLKPPKNSGDVLSVFLSMRQSARAESLPKPLNPRMRAKKTLKNQADIRSVLQLSPRQKSSQVKNPAEPKSTWAEIEPDQNPKPSQNRAQAMAPKPLNPRK